MTSAGVRMRGNFIALTAAALESRWFPHRLRLLPEESLRTSAHRREGANCQNSPAVSAPFWRAVPRASCCARRDPASHIEDATS
jgi:hypothetical protein